MLRCLCLSYHRPLLCSTVSHQISITWLGQHLMVCFPTLPIEFPPYQLQCWLQPCQTSHVVPLPGSLGMFSLSSIKPFLHKHKICQLILLLLDTLQNWHTVCPMHFVCKQSQWDVLTPSPLAGCTSHPPDVPTPLQWLHEEHRLLTFGARNHILVWYLKWTVSQSCISTYMGGYLSIGL